MNKTFRFLIKSSFDIFFKPTIILNNLCREFWGTIPRRHQEYKADTKRFHRSLERPLWVHSTKTGPRNRGRVPLESQAF